MSIFQLEDIDYYLVQYLDPEDKAKLSIVNKYYYNLFKDDLINFKDYHKYINFQRKTLLSAVKFGKLDVVKWIYKKDNTNIKLSIKKSIFYEYLDIFIWLCNCVKYNNYNRLALLSVEYDKLEIFQYIEQKIKIRADSFAKYACKFGSLKILKYLIKRIDPNFDESTLFRISSSWGNLDIMEYLFEINASIYADYNDLFISICKEGYLGAAKFFVIKQLINNESMYEAFEYACERRHTKIIELLLERLNITTNIADMIFDTCSLEIIELIINKPFPISNTIISILCDIDNKNLMNLISDELILNNMDEFIKYSVMHNNMKLIIKLINLKADVKNIFYNACRYDKTKIIIFLVANNYINIINPEIYEITSEYNSFAVENLFNIISNRISKTISFTNNDNSMIILDSSEEDD